MKNLTEFQLCNARSIRAYCVCVSAVLSLSVAVAVPALLSGCERRTATRGGHSEAGQADGPVADGGGEMDARAAAEAQSLLNCKHQLSLLMAAVVQFDDGEIARRLMGGPTIEGERVQGVMMPFVYGQETSQPKLPKILAADVPLVDLILLRAFVESIGEAPSGCGLLDGTMRWHQRLVAAFSMDRRQAFVMDSIRTRLFAAERGGPAMVPQWPDATSVSYGDAVMLLSKYIAEDAGAPLEALADGSLLDLRDGKVVFPLWKGHMPQSTVASALPEAAAHFADVRLVGAIAFVTPDRTGEAGKRAITFIQWWVSRLERTQLDERSRLVVMQAKQVLTDR
jgi:hypothetical protein